MKNHEARDAQFPPVAVVAERDLMLRMTLAALLSCDGYRVFQQDSEPASVSYIDSIDDLDVLFVDLDEPEWKSIVRQTHSMTPDAFAIGISASDSIAENADLEKFGIQVCLHKPILYSEVRRALSETVEGRCAVQLSFGDFLASNRSVNRL